MNESRPPESSEIATLLEAAPYVDDAGFTDRVVQALPARRRRVALSYGVLPAFTAVACALAYAWSGQIFLGGRESGALSLAMTWSFAAVALALLVVAAATMLAAED